MHSDEDWEAYEREQREEYYRNQYLQEDMHYHMQLQQMRNEITFTRMLLIEKEDIVEGYELSDELPF